MVKTVNDAYLDARGKLRAAGIAGSEIEARELVCLALGMDETAFFQKRRELLFDDKLKKIERLVELRLTGTPIQYIVGKWEFFGLDFKVNEHTLIPRSDTETLVETALAFINDRGKTRVLDLCCGTGCIGISLARFARHPITCLLADISPEALRVAKDNTILNRVTGSVSTAQCDVYQPCPQFFGAFDLITCNPPYIPSDEIPTLDAEVQREPHLALDGGPDGLNAYRAICLNFKPALKEGGALMFEVGLGQFEQVRTIMLKAGFEDINVFKDLRGIERVVCGVRPYELEEIVKKAENENECCEQLKYMI